MEINGELFIEIGITYSFYNFEKATEFKYTAFSYEKEIRSSNVYIQGNRDDFFELLNHWNRFPQWKYVAE